MQRQAQALQFVPIGTHTLCGPVLSGSKSRSIQKPASGFSGTTALAQRTLNQITIKRQFIIALESAMRFQRERENLEPLEPLEQYGSYKKPIIME